MESIFSNAVQQMHPIDVQVSALKIVDVSQLPSPHVPRRLYLRSLGNNLLAVSTTLIFPVSLTSSAAQICEAAKDELLSLSFAKSLVRGMKDRCDLFHSSSSTASLYLLSDGQAVTVSPCTTKIAHSAYPTGTPTDHIDAHSRSKDEPPISNIALGALMGAAAIIALVSLVCCGYYYYRNSVEKKNQKKYENDPDSSSDDYTSVSIESDKEDNDIDDIDISWNHLETIKVGGRNANGSCVLGKGSYGVVFKAAWKRPSLPVVYVAVKIFKHDPASSFETREHSLRLEAHALQTASCGGTNGFVIQVHGVTSGPRNVVTETWREKIQAEALRPDNLIPSHDGRLLALVTSLAEGPDLAKFLEQKRVSNEDFSMKGKLRLLMEISHGICHLHANGVVHGDLKPANVLLQDTKRLRPLLSDFGNAKVRNALQNDDSTLRSSRTNQEGTFQYDAPELAMQTHGRSWKTDIFALGTLFHEVLTGRQPWKGYTEVKRANEFANGGNLPFGRRRNTRSSSTSFRWWSPLAQTSMSTRPDEKNVFPENTPELVIELVKACLSHEREIRPTAEHIFETLCAAYQKCNDKFDIFLSYCWGANDIRKPLTDEIFKRLVSLGYTVWMDSFDMKHELNASMSKGIDNSRVVVVLMSPEYAKSVACNYEVDTFYAKSNKPVIVCMLEKAFWKTWKKPSGPAPPPPSLFGSLFCRRSNQIVPMERAISDEFATKLGLLTKTLPSHECLELLIGQGADVNAQDKDGNCPAQVACRSSNARCLELLISQGAIVTSVDKNSLRQASTDAARECIALLEEAEAVAAAAQPRVAVATASTQRPRIAQIRNLCPPIDTRVSTEIIAAAKDGLASSLRRLCSKWSFHPVLDCVDEDDFEQKTALLWAVKLNREEHVKILLDASADPNVANSNKETPCFVACDNGYAGCLKLLLQFGAKIDAPNDQGQTPVFAACRRGVIYKDKTMFCDFWKAAEYKGWNSHCVPPDEKNPLDESTAMPRLSRLLNEHLRHPFDDNTALEDEPEEVKELALICHEREELEIFRKQAAEEMKVKQQDIKRLLRILEGFENILPPPPPHFFSSHDVEADERRQAQDDARRQKLDAIQKIRAAEELQSIRDEANSMQAKTQEELDNAQRNLAIMHEEAKQLVDNIMQCSQELDRCNLQVQFLEERHKEEAKEHCDELEQAKALQENTRNELDSIRQKWQEIRKENEVEKAKASATRLQLEQTLMRQEEVEEELKKKIFALNLTQEEHDANNERLAAAEVRIQNLERALRLAEERSAHFQYASEQDRARLAAALEGFDEALICPISYEAFVDPVICSDGHTYSREAIESWFARKNTSPLTNAVLANRTLLPNHVARVAIETRNRLNDE